MATAAEIAAARKELGVSDELFPRHIAIIMDGNGRWASTRGLPRTAGHAQGAQVTRRIVTEGCRLGLAALTLYSFSIENWRRPKDEVSALMHLYAEYLRTEREELMANNVRMRHLGRREGLPQSVLDELDHSISISASNTGMWLNLALNYGSRAEVADGVRRIARNVAEGRLNWQDVSEESITNSLYTAGLPDPDLLIRTAGELRLSNFLLWQISYAEIYVTETLWPDFDAAELHRGILAFAQRNRRFGGLSK